ncbi:MAG TPA: lamin tail domain-containing protein, partial [bacterium]|nr:lamin tail domain-containing protein [bacterium]
TITGHTDKNGVYYVYLTTSLDSGTNSFKFINATLGELTYTDTTRDLFPIISEIGWAGNNDFEFIEIYNPLPTPVDLSNYHIGDASSSTAIPQSAFTGKTLPAYGYAVIFEARNDSAVPQPSLVNSNVLVINYDLTANLFTNSAETVTIYNDGQFLDRHGKFEGTTWFGGAAATDYYSMERKWYTRSGDLSNSWGTSTAPHYYAGGSVLGRATPGYANSINLYNSDISATNTMVGLSDSIVLVSVQLVQNDGRPVRSHNVWFKLSGAATANITFEHPKDVFGVTSDTGWTYGYVKSDRSGTAVITVDTPVGVTDTVMIYFDFTPPYLSTFSDSDMWDTSPLNSAYRVNVTVSDTLSGLATDYPKIRYGWNSTASMGSWLNMNYSIQNDYYYDTSLFNWYQYSGETLYVQILMQDKCGNTDTKTYTQYINIAPPLSIKITAPDTYLHDTYTQIITVSGTTLNSTAGDTIIIYTYSNSTLTPNTSTILTSINGN